MRWAAIGAVMMLVGLPSLWAGDEVKDKPKEPEKSKAAADVDALIEVHYNAVNDYDTKNQEAYKNAKTDEERLKIRDAAPKPDETMDKLWALLEKNPNDKEASLSALDWLLRNYGNDEKGQKGRNRVLDLLIKDHAADVKYDPGDPKIVHILDNLINVYSTKAEDSSRSSCKEPRERYPGQGLPCPGRAPYEGCRCGPRTQG